MSGWRRREEVGRERLMLKWSEYYINVWSNPLRVWSVKGILHSLGITNEENLSGYYK